jgi:hypothetical protein
MLTHTHTHTLPHTLSVVTADILIRQHSKFNLPHSVSPRHMQAQSLSFGKIYTKHQNITTRHSISHACDHQALTGKTSVLTPNTRCHHITALCQLYSPKQFTIRSAGYRIWGSHAGNFKMTFNSEDTACSLMVGANVSDSPNASIFRAVTSHFYNPELGQKLNGLQWSCLEISTQDKVTV